MIIYIFKKIYWRISSSFININKSFAIYHTAEFSLTSYHLGTLNVRILTIYKGKAKSEKMLDPSVAKVEPSL